MSLKPDQELLNYRLVERIGLFGPWTGRHSRAEVELGLTANMSMAYNLERLEGDRTRLMSRVRVHIQGGLALPYIYLFDEWVNFVMQRRQLRGIKARAEA